jgi:hypothetical protein
MSFASFYSIQKILPDAKFVMAIRRTNRLDMMFPWPSKCRVKMLSYTLPENIWEPAFIALSASKAGYTQPMVVIEAGTMAIRSPSNQLISDMEKTGILKGRNNSTWYFKGVVDELLLKIPPSISTEGFITMSDFSSDAQSGELPLFVSCGDSVSKFVTAEWIDKVEYPFPHAERFADSTTLTANEASVLKLWKMTDQVFSTVSRG